jgi:hypothetical protein
MKPWKAQKFFGDVLYDLRNRNLLLIVIMLVVAIVAVPLILSKSGSGNDAVSIGPGVQSSAEVPPETQPAVLAYDPGVRNFKQRLKDLSSKNPFAEQFAPAAAAADSTVTSSSTTSGSTTGSTPGSVDFPGSNNTTGESGSGGGNGGSGGGNGNKNKTQTYVYQTDVLVGEAGGTLAPANKIPQFTFLPSPDKPVLVYLGTTSNGSQAIFLVSRDVASVGGDGTCFPSADDCQLLGLDPGKAADVIYRPDGKTYHLQVVRIKRFTK